MLLPAEYFWLEPVLLAAGIVFVVGYLGNILAFGSRFVNALVTAIVFGIIFGFAVKYGFASVFVNNNTASILSFLPIEYGWLEPVILASIIVFVVDLIGNTLSFSSRFVNAIVTAVVFAIIFGVAAHYGYSGVEIQVNAPS